MGAGRRNGGIGMMRLHGFVSYGDKENPSFFKAGTIAIRTAEMLDGLPVYVMPNGVSLALKDSDVDEHEDTCACDFCTGQRSWRSTEEYMRWSGGGDNY